MPQFRNVFERFSKIYAGLGDEQLLSLANDLDQLELDAQEALQAELLHRRLELHSAVGAETPEETHPEHGEKLDGPESEWVFETTSQALAAKSALESAGIRAIVNLPPSKFYANSPSVTFVSNGTEKLREIYEDLQASDNEEPVGDFVFPTCPACGREDVLLTSVEPFNTWECESCSHTWQES
ncbi:hypothetical protein FTW19_01240 [Terriglobus albidus]|uniref:Uncharacterized protein n=1 Tax=Terriglobus albidus TaxID=1592106 RepID=A0A5B9E8Z9_9BACT|nr:hypothetical protein [Terriglobus albidus]QEE26747.1 hypothetical protein FTW19_01240 [Terriglobus albidus]